MPKVSVTIPTYNRAQLVAESIESVLRQTFHDFEVVVIDDGSTDNTREVVEAIADPRVKYFYKDNGGCSSGRNAGIMQCSGEYIGFLDSDDLWPREFLEVMVSKLDNHLQYGCAYAPVVMVYPDGSMRESYGQGDCKSGWITEDLFKTSFIWLQGCVFRREALEGFRFDESVRNAGDTDAILRLSTRIQFLFVPDVKVTFRANHGVSNRQERSNVNCNRIRLLERFYYRLGGQKYVRRSVARRKLSHACRSVGKTLYRMSAKKGAVSLFRKAIGYHCWDVRLYGNLLKALVLKEDKIPDWQMPEPMPDIEL